MAASVSPTDLVHRIEADLRGNILPFWIAHAVNRPGDTFHGSLTNALEVDRAAERGALLSSRILWTYARAFRQYGDEAYRAMADLAHADLMTRYHDAQHDGFYWSIDASSHVLRDRKQVYGQAFAIYALSEYHAATGLSGPLARAIAVFRLLEKHAFEPICQRSIE